MLIVNLFGEPGCGKSTMAADVFARLKKMGVRSELVTEHAKDLTWEKAYSRLAFQPLVFAEQAWRLKRLEGQVDIAVTDSPLLLSLVYSTSPQEHYFRRYVREYEEEQDTLDVLVNRSHPYVVEGRNQDETEADSIRDRILALLEHRRYTSVTADDADVVARLAIAKFSKFVSDTASLDQA